MHRAHRNGYDHSVRAAGVTMVEIGSDAGTTPGDLEAAINERTGLVVYLMSPWAKQGALSLAETCAIAHQHGVPVLVDAAAVLPPAENLTRFIAEGADLVTFSGGKGLRGPQSSGMVLGKKAIIEACRANGSPNHSLGRPMKVGKEEMLGLLAAVEWSLDQDEAYVLAGYEATVRGWLDGLGNLPGVTVERGYPSEAGQPHSRAILRIGPACARTRDEIVKALWEGDPRIAVAPVGADGIALNPQTLGPGEDALVLKALRGALA